MPISIVDFKFFPFSNCILSEGYVMLQGARPLDF